MIQKKTVFFPGGAPAPVPNLEVIVKLKTTEIAKSALRNFANMAKENKLVGLMANARVENIRPLFPGLPTRQFALAMKTGIEPHLAAMDDEIDPALSGLNVVRFFTEQDAAAGIIELAADPSVEYAHIPAVRKFALNTDPDQNRQWGLRAINYFRAVATPGYSNAHTIRIAILDSGIDPNHPDLQEIFSQHVNFTTLGDNDDSGHGTHVAGIIAALTNNGIGITGTCASTQLMILRGLTVPYQPTAYYNAIRYAFNNGAQVLNCSLGGAHDPTEALLMQTAISRGVIVVAAMGNDFLDGNLTSYPAALPDVIAVGASDETDRRAVFSQIGPHIHLMAPGTNILSSVPGYPVSLTTKQDYDTWDGTSMATPFVTAAVASLLARRPGSTLADIKQALAQSADKISGQSGFTNELGFGRLNLDAALRII